MRFNKWAEGAEVKMGKSREIGKESYSYMRIF